MNPSVSVPNTPTETRLDRKRRFVRSWLFAPANVTRRASKALHCGAGAAVLDLEDAVAISQKEQARGMAVDCLREPRKSFGYVRVNPYGEGCAQDLAVVVGPWLDGILVPKAEEARTMQAIDAALLTLEAGCGLAPGTIDMVPIIESCAGMARVHEVAAATPRISRLAFGAGDFTRDLAIEWTRDESELEPARFQIAVASKAAGLAPPIDTVFIGLSDPDGMAASVARGRRWGFGSKTCIHPDQLEAIHRGFAPPADAVAQARRIVEAFEESERAGNAAIRLDGKLVDYAIVKAASDTLALADLHAQAERELTPHH